jgi:hypothetical protein
MNPGNSVRDAGRQENAGRHDAVAGYPGGTPEQPPGIPQQQKALQDIQEIIDKLAAVTEQLNRRGDAAG